MRIIFVRHGQDDDTRRGGWSSYGLLEEGHAQAKKVAVYFRNECGYDIRHIYASDLTRTMETAQHIADALNLPIRKEPDLREINNGSLAGMPNEEALMKYPGLFFNTLKMDECYPGGESPRAFYERIRAWFKKSIAESRDKQVDTLMVTHGGVIKVLYHIVNGWEWSNQRNNVPTEKCSIHVLNVDTMAFEIENQIVW